MPRDPLPSALGVTLAVWTLLAAAALLRPAFGDAAALLGVAGACPLALGRVGLRAPRFAPAPPLLAAAAGLASLPGWLALLALLGGALGLAPREGSAAAPGPLRILCDVGLGPLLEEALYRGRLLPALRGALGAPLGLLLSSALFALPHGDSWGLLAAFGVGLCLGGAFLATGSLSVCVAYHAGLNLAALGWLLGRWPPLPAGAAVGLASLLAAAAIARARAARGVA
jgi:membrane protease YdiL (CAAX protease family)